MGFMEKWGAWSQVQWDNWGSKLQPTYTKIEKWDSPEWVKNMLGDVWNLLDKELQKKLYKTIIDICKNYDDEFAKQLIQKVQDLIKKLFLK